jgi:PAS domain S-box-containing protein
MVGRISSLRWRVSIAAAVSLTVTAAALFVALAAAASARAEGRNLSARLVPAAAAASTLLEQYTAQQNALREYVTSGRVAALAPFNRDAARIAGTRARAAALLRPDPGTSGRLAVAMAAYRAWLAGVAGPELAAGRSGNFARAQALQANVTATRPYTLAVRTAFAALQDQITNMQAQATSRLIADQLRLIAALVAVCAVVAIITAGAVVMVRHWLLRPFGTLRRAAEAVAAGSYDTQVPAVGPAELDELGRAAELMRTRLVAALTDAERAEQRFRGLFQSSPDATMTVSADRAILMANVQAERLFGYTSQELVGQPVAKLIPAAATAPDDYLGQLATEPQGGRMVTAVRKEGGEFPAESTVTALPTESGLVGLICIRDISERLAAAAEGERLRAEAERERYEAKLAQAQRLESLGQLVGGVAHDFNNLLSLIGGYTDFVADEVKELADADQRLEAVLADVEQIRDATQRAVSLTRQLLIFARRDVARRQVLDVAVVIRGVEKLLRRTLGEHIELMIDTEDGLWPVLADPGQVEQVLVNLAVNARDAMPGGGRLTIETGNVVADEAYVTDRPGMEAGRYTRLRVSDTGTGMDKDVLARVFEPFYTTKPQGQGTGLGLATVYGIITRAGGYAQIYSEPGLGTSVTALLPATEAPVSTAEPQAAVAARGYGETVLLVEDEQSLKELGVRILTRNGYRVYAAATPQDAHRYASDPAQPVDLLLTDVVMPDMLGNELAALVRQARPGLPVLFMSGYARPILDVQGAVEPDVDLLEKPFTEATLLARVRHAIDSREG